MLKIKRKKLRDEILKILELEGAGAILWGTENQRKTYQTILVNKIMDKIEQDNENDEAIDNQGDIDDDFEERSEGIEKYGGKPLTGYF